MAYMQCSDAGKGGSIAASSAAFEGETWNIHANDPLTKETHTYYSRTLPDVTTGLSQLAGPNSKK